MFGFSPFASLPFTSLKQVVTTVSTWGQKGGIGRKHKEEIKRSQRAEMQEHIETLFAEPAAEIAKEIKEEVKEYVKPSQGFSIHSIDYKKLAQNIELAQRIIQKAQEIKQEQEDETILLMLL